MSSQNLRLLGFLKTPRLLRLSKLLRYLDKLKGANLFRIGRLVFLICMFSHFVACGYCLLADFESSSPTWVDYALMDAASLKHNQPFFNPPGMASGTMTSLYANAFYQSWTMLYGNGANCYTSEERFFVSTILMLGGFVQAVVVGNVALLVTNFDQAAARYRSQADVALSTAAYLELPHELQERITNYFEFMSSTSHPGSVGIGELAGLPKKLYQDIVYHLHGEALNAVPLLRGLDPAFLADLATRVRSTVVIRGEAVFEAGELSREMYFIVQGSAQVVDDAYGDGAGQHATPLPAGSFFGELALLADVRRSATVVAVTNCDINVLTRASLCAVLADYPAVEAKIRERGQRRLRELAHVAAAMHGDPKAGNSMRAHSEAIVRPSNLLRGGQADKADGPGAKLSVVEEKGAESLTAAQARRKRREQELAANRGEAEEAEHRISYMRQPGASESAPNGGSSAMDSLPPGPTTEALQYLRAELRAEAAAAAARQERILERFVAAQSAHLLGLAAEEDTLADDEGSKSK